MSKNASSIEGDGLPFLILPHALLRIKQGYGDVQPAAVSLQD